MTELKSEEFPFESSHPVFILLYNDREPSASFGADQYNTFVPVSEILGYLDRMTSECKERLKHLLGQNIEILEENRNYVQTRAMPINRTDATGMALMGAEWSSNSQRDYDSLKSLYEML